MFKLILEFRVIQMRLVLNFICNSNNQEIENLGNLKDIRRYFISFIKKAFYNYDPNIFHFLFNYKRSKPYVFSPYLGKKFSQGKIDKKISLIFSTGDFSLFSSFWNSLLKLKEKGIDYIQIENLKFNLDNIRLLKDEKIISEEVVFKTIGVSILTDPTKSPKNFKEWYIIPSDFDNNYEKYNQVLKFRTKERIKSIMGIDKDVDIEFMEYDEIYETVIPHYDGYVRGFRGVFKLRGDIEVLKFLYDYGFGVRTGQGFGLLDIVKQK